MEPDVAEDGSIKRGEYIFCALFVALCALVPLWAPDIYPFTSMPMFSDSQREYWYFTISDGSGREVPVAATGLANRDVINPHARIGVKLPPTIFDSWADFMAKSHQDRGTMIKNAIQVALNDGGTGTEAGAGWLAPFHVTLIRIGASQEDRRIKREQVAVWHVD